MIDFENYERVTVRHEDGSHSFMYDYNATTPPIKTLLDRLAELEDLIEKGKLVPKYCIVNDYVGYHLCAQTTVNMLWRDFYAYHLYKQMLDDIVLMDAYLLGEQIVPKFGTKTIKNKTVKTVKFYPESRVKHVIIFEDNKNE